MRRGCSFAFGSIRPARLFDELIGVYAAAGHQYALHDTGKQAQRNALYAVEAAGCHHPQHGQEHARAAQNERDVLVFTSCEALSALPTM